MTRSRPFRLTTALLLSAGAFLSTGCVSQGSHDDLVRVNRQLEELQFERDQQIAELQAIIAEKNATLRAMNDQSGTNAALRARLAEEQQTIASLRAEIAGLQGQLAELGQGAERIVVVEGLPPEVSNALSELAAANRDLMEYDESRGMIRLRSDLTFALGSADVNDQAKAALSRLAGVLNGGTARQFDIQVIGHTDAVPVRSAQGRQQHIDNRGLSSNRGDSVARVLIANGVSAGRVVSGGRGATQPIAENDARGRSQANRRVEIFLVKGGGAGGAQAPASAPAQPAGASPQPGVVEGQPDAADDSIYK